MIVRDAELKDLEAIIALGTRLILAGAYRTTRINARACMNRLLIAMQDAHQKLLVAFHDEKLVGFLILVSQRYWWSETDSYVLDDGIFAVRPGAGVALVREGKKWAKSIGAHEVLISFNSQIKTEKSVEVMVKGAGFTRRGISVSIPVSP